MLNEWLNHIRVFTLTPIISNFFLASAFLFLSSSLSAEVDYAGDGGFSVSNTSQTQADAATVYQAMVRYFKMVEWRTQLEW